MRLLFLVALASGMLLPGMARSHAATPSLAPSFDCAKAESSAEKLVCSDDQLAALDRETARLFRLARDGAHLSKERRGDLIATQRGWIKGRDDCWKADDLRRCVYDSYVIRIHELRQGYADARSEDAAGISKGPFVVECPGLDAAIGLTFVSVDPGAACLQWRDRFLVMTQARSASGARYVATDADGESQFWVKGNEAMLDLPGRSTLQCHISEPG